MVTIRNIKADDLGETLAINQANVPEVGDLDAPRLADLHAMSSIALGVFTDHPADGERTEGKGTRVTGGNSNFTLLGFCLVLPPEVGYTSVNYRWFMERYTDAFYLDRVAFDASARRRGLGTELYAAVEDRIRSRYPDVARLGLEVNCDPPNEPSLRFHSRLGFREVGRQSTPYGIEVALMTKMMR